MVIIIMGPPGVGKGTQAKHICAEFSAAHLSAGDILRGQVAQQTPLGEAAKAKMAAGELVPDDMIIKMMLPHITQAKGAVLLDGFPRTREQAEAIAAADIKVGAVIDLDAADELIVARLSGRLSHPASGRVYHTQFSPPKAPGVDDVTGEPLVQRPDDNPETVRARLSVYRAQTAPLKDYYRRQAAAGGLAYIAVDGEQEIAQVAAALSGQLRPLMPA